MGCSSSKEDVTLSPGVSKVSDASPAAPATAAPAHADPAHDAPATAAPAHAAPATAAHEAAAPATAAPVAAPVAAAAAATEDVCTLYYFDINGRGEAMRMLLAHAKVQYKDCRITMDKWPALKPTMPNGALPALCLKDGHMMG